MADFPLSEVLQTQKCSARCICIAVVLRWYWSSAFCQTTVFSFTFNVKSFRTNDALTPYLVPHPLCGVFIPPYYRVTEKADFSQCFLIIEYNQVLLRWNKGDSAKFLMQKSNDDDDRLGAEPHWTGHDRQSSPGLILWGFLCIILILPGTNEPQNLKFWTAGHSVGGARHRRITASPTFIMWHFPETHNLLWMACCWSWRGKSGTH